MSLSWQSLATHGSDHLFSLPFFLLPLPTWLLALKVCKRIKGVYFVYFTVLHPSGEESAPVSVMYMNMFESELPLGEGWGHILADILMVYHQTLF